MGKGGRGGRGRSKSVSKSHGKKTKREKAKDAFHAAMLFMPFKSRTMNIFTFVFGSLAMIGGGVYSFMRMFPRYRLTS